MEPIPTRVEPQSRPRPQPRRRLRAYAVVALLSLAACAATAPAPTAPSPNPSAQAAPPSAAPAPTPADRTSPLVDPIEVRFICLAPSPYTDRHDALRAGFGIYLSLQNLLLENRLPISLSFYDGSTFYDDSERVQAALSGADVLLIGGSTWNQGPAFYLRRFLEQAGATFLGGVVASAWATAGGSHTGGEEVVGTTLRSMMGLGASVFTLGQKYMVFTTDERIAPAEPGHFSLLDVYYMDQFARYIAVTAMARQDRAAAQRLAKALAVSPFYFLGSFPHSDAELARYRPLQARLNAAADASSPEYLALRALLAGSE